MPNKYYTPEIKAKYATFKRHKPRYISFPLPPEVFGLKTVRGLLNKFAQWLDDILWRCWKGHDNMTGATKHKNYPHIKTGKQADGVMFECVMCEAPKVLVAKFGKAGSWIITRLIAWTTWGWVRLFGRGKWVD